MPSLAELQRGFADALRDPGAPPPDAVRRAAGTPGRFNVYRNNMAAGLVDALRATFPAVQRLVGKEYFDAVARAYIDRHPPGSPVLLLYGRDLGSFLESFPSASGVPYLGDVARLEWARVNALHAADAAPMEIAALAGLSAEKLEAAVLSPHPSLNRVDSPWPVVSLWRACLDAGDSQEVDMSGREHAVVIRPALKVGVYAAPPGAGAFLEALQNGSALGAAAREALDATREVDLSAHLEFVFRIGAVCAVNFPQQDDQQ